MDSDSEKESLEGELEENLDSSSKDRSRNREVPASWGKAKYDYYFTDYVDKDYPSSLSRKEEKLASIEQEEAQRIQKKLFSNLDDINLQPVIDYEDTVIANDSASAPSHNHEDLIEFLEKQNKAILESKHKKVSSKLTKEKSVRFDLEQVGSDECEFESDEEEDEDDDDDEATDDDQGDDDESQTNKNEVEDERKRRPINMAIKKNRGLTPYKKKEYRNPRVKHKLKYKKAMTKRRKLVKEAQTEFYRYSGEATGIKTSTIKSIKLC